MPTRSSRGPFVVRPPGDKSISHRAVLLGAIAEGETAVTNFSPGRDCVATLECLRALGVEIAQAKDAVRVEGRGLFGLNEPRDVVDCGNSGTTMRLLSGILAGQPFMSVLTGDDSLRSRPMGRIVRPLREMGADISGRDGGQNAPLVIKGPGCGAAGQARALRPLDEYTLPVASAQVKSCVILAGLYAGGATTIVEPVPVRDHSERIIPLFGGRIGTGGSHITVHGPQRLRGTTLRVPGDISSAAFWLAAGAILPGSDLLVEEVGLNPTRTGFVRALQRMGCDLEFLDVREEWEPSGSIRVAGGPLKAAEVSPRNVPGILDELPILGICAAVASGRTVVRGAAELRHKESDRISAIVTNLRAMGAEAGETPDGFWVEGGGRLKGALIETHSDHRIAMAFAIAGLVAEGDTVLDHPECIDISYPGFLDTLACMRKTL